MKFFITSQEPDFLDFGMFILKHAVYVQRICYDDSLFFSRNLIYCTRDDLNYNPLGLGCTV